VDIGWDAWLLPEGRLSCAFPLLARGVRQQRRRPHRPIVCVLARIAGARQLRQLCCSGVASHDTAALSAAMAGGAQGRPGDGRVNGEGRGSFEGPPRPRTARGSSLPGVSFVLGQCELLLRRRQLLGGQAGLPLLGSQADAAFLAGKDVRFGLRSVGKRNLGYRLAGAWQQRLGGASAAGCDRGFGRTGAAWQSDNLDRVRQVHGAGQEVGHLLR